MEAGLVDDHQDGAELRGQFLEDGPQFGLAVRQLLVEDLLSGRGQPVAVVGALPDVQPEEDAHAACVDHRVPTRSTWSAVLPWSPSPTTGPGCWYASPPPTCMRDVGVRPLSRHVHRAALTRGPAQPFPRGAEPGGAGAAARSRSARAPRAGPHTCPEGVRPPPRGRPAPSRRPRLRRRGRQRQASARRPLGPPMGDRRGTSGPVPAMSGREAVILGILNFACSRERDSGHEQDGLDGRYLQRRFIFIIMMCVDNPDMCGGRTTTVTATQAPRAVPFHEVTVIRPRLSDRSCAGARTCRAGRRLSVRCFEGMFRAAREVGHRSRAGVVTHR